MRGTLGWQLLRVYAAELLYKHDLSNTAILESVKPAAMTCCRGELASHLLIGE